jgi:cell division septation protein DedD
MPKELGKLSEKEIQQRLYGKYSNPRGETKPEQKPVPNAVKKQPIAEPKEKNNIEKGSGMKIVWSFALGIVIIFLTGLFIMRSESTPQNPQASKKATPRKPSISNPKTVSAPVSRPYTIQVMVYESKKGAEISVGDLKKRGFPAYIKQSTMVSGKPQFRIYIGEFTTQEEAKATLTMLKTKPSYQESFIRKR